MTADTSAKLVDIVPPVMPPGTDWTAIAALAVLITLSIAAASALYWLRRRRLAARRRLNRLQRAVREQRIEPRAAVYAAAAELQRGLGLRRLTASTPLPDTIRRRDDEARLRWQRFAAELAACRYAPAAPARGAALDAIDDAKRWLRPWS